jgi:hypothetical protein
MVAQRQCIGRSAKTRENGKPLFKGPPTVRSTMNHEYRGFPCIAVAREKFFDKEALDKVICLFAFFKCPQSISPMACSDLNDAISAVLNLHRLDKVPVKPLDPIVGPWMQTSVLPDQAIEPALPVECLDCFASGQLADSPNP